MYVKNNSVYITYDYVEYGVTAPQKGKPEQYSKFLRRNFEEGGAEYLRIINHSPDKKVEFFLAGIPGEYNDGSLRLPSVTYKNAPLYYLLFPDEKPEKNMSPYGEIIYFEGNRIGDLEVVQPWSVEEVADLYRKEYAEASDVMLLLENSSRMIILLNGTAPDSDRFKGNTFYGYIAQGKEMREKEKLWPISTAFMFRDEIEGGRL